MNQMKADLHMHLEDYASKEDLKKLLKMCENEKLNAISILSYNSIVIYQDGGAFQELAKETNDDFKGYFSGKIIPAVEMVATMDDMPSNLGKVYNGYRSDIVLYDFDLRKMSEYLNEVELKKAWVEDFNMFSEKCLEVGIRIPPIENFVNNFVPLSFVTQWIEMCKEIPGYIEKLESMFNIKLNSASDLTRNHISNPNGKLFFKQKLFPDVSAVLRMAKQVGAKVCIAHPAHMSKDFDTADYIESMVNFSRSDSEFQRIEYACGDYMLNTEKDCETILKTANKLKIKLLCGSDMRFVDQMYYISPLTNGEKVYYKPTPGFAIAKQIEKGEGSIYMSEDYLEDFGDVKSFYIEYSDTKVKG